MMTDHVRLFCGDCLDVFCDGSRMVDITAKQLQIVNTIARLTDALGYPPGVREIAREIGCAKSTMQYHLSVLHAKGLIEREPKRDRTVKLVRQ